MADNWAAQWTSPIRAPSGERWDFGRGGSRAMIGTHPCYSPDKDLVIPVFAPPQRWLGSATDAGADNRTRRTFAYFSGNLGLNEPARYARGVRRRLHAAFGATEGWRLVGNRGGRYASDMEDAEFCIVPPGGDGWSSRVDDAVRHVDAPCERSACGAAAATPVAAR